MRNLENVFKNRVIDDYELLKFGFKKDDDSFTYEKGILDDKFLVRVFISQKEKYSQVIDLLTMDEYVLVDIKNHVGNYVLKIKEEYESIINEIIDNCTKLDIFKFAQSKEVIEYIRSKYNGELEFLWEKFPSNAVWRNSENKKWYGFLSVISKSKLGIDSDELVDTLNLRYKRGIINDIVDNKIVFPGYHMNKNNWITIILNESMDIHDIFELIDNSYELSLKK